MNVAGDFSRVRGWLPAPFVHGSTLALQMDAMRAMHQAIQDRIGEGGIADVLVPVLDW